MENEEHSRWIRDKYKQIICLALLSILFPLLHFLFILPNYGDFGVLLISPYYLVIPLAILLGRYKKYNNSFSKIALVAYGAILTFISNYFFINYSPESVIKMDPGGAFLLGAFISWTALYITEIFVVSFFGYYVDPKVIDSSFMIKSNNKKNTESLYEAVCDITETFGGYTFRTSTDAGDSYGNRTDRALLKKDSDILLLFYNKSIDGLYQIEPVLLEKYKIFYEMLNVNTEDINERDRDSLDKFLDNFKTPLIPERLIKAIKSIDWRQTMKQSILFISLYTPMILLFVYSDRIFTFLRSLDFFKIILIIIGVPASLYYSLKTLRMIKGKD